MRRLVRKLEQRGIAGVCIEDKQFPKTNSFLNGERQPLADIEEFAGKIAAGKDTQQDANFSIVARVEALIAGWGMDEALRRAEAYRLAGADAILIHSKLSKPDEILAFAREWARRCPLVIVPTRYYSTPTEVFRQAGISTVIWANHLVRSAASAMQSVAKEILDSETLVNVEDRIVSVNEIFRLQDADEYSAAERLYLVAAGTPAARPSCWRRAAAAGSSRSRRIARRSCCRSRASRCCAGWSTASRSRASTTSPWSAAIAPMRSIRPESSSRERALCRDRRTGLARLRDRVARSDTVISYGDLLFRSYVLRDLVESKADFAVVVDSLGLAPGNRTVRDFAYCSRGDDRGLFGTRVLLERVTSKADPNGGTRDRRSAPAPPHGRWIGLLKVSARGLARLKTVLDRLRERDPISIGSTCRRCSTR